MAKHINSNGNGNGSGGIGGNRAGDTGSFAVVGSGHGGSDAGSRGAGLGTGRKAHAMRPAGGGSGRPMPTVPQGAAAKPTPGMPSPSKKATAAARKEHVRGRRAMRLMTLVVVVALAFVAGFFVRGQSTLLASLGFAALGGDASAAQSATAAKSTYDSVSVRLSEVEDVLSENGMAAYSLDEATAGVLESFAETTDDAYLRYFDPGRYNAYVSESAEGSYAGIGALFAEYNGRAYVADVFEGSVAEAQGVQQGDFVVAIDGDGGHEWSMTEVVKSLSREEGERVVITWMRPATLEAETGEEFSTTLTCASHAVRNVTSQLVGTVGYLQLKQVTQNASELVSQAVADLAAQGAKSFVLDIRDNPGGYLTQAVDIANLFLKSGVVVEIETLGSKTTKTASGTVVTNAPLVVLVNEYTSAAAEVLAAALQDNQRATVVGTTTRGKGSVQVVRELSFGGALKYTAAYYKSPLGHAINGVGVIPNISVGSGDSAAGDAQKSLAMETAQSLVTE